MPTYVYKFVETGETIEVQQAFTDDTLTETAHPETGEVMAVKKIFQPIGVTFKGGGFYKTDSRPGSSKSSSTPADTSSTSSESSSASDSGSTATKDSAPSTPASTSATTSSTSSTSSSSSSSSSSGSSD